MPISTSHFHFVVWAAVGRTENGYTDVTYVDVIADTEAQAVSQCPRGHSLILTNQESLAVRMLRGLCLNALAGIL